jgi:hypothetical protein
VTECNRTVGHGYRPLSCGPVTVQPHYDTHCNRYRTGLDRSQPNFQSPKIVCNIVKRSVVHSFSVPTQVLSKCYFSRAPTATNHNHQDIHPCHHEDVVRALNSPSLQPHLHSLLFIRLHCGTHDGTPPSPSKPGRSYHQLMTRVRRCDDHSKHLMPSLESLP